VVASSSVDGSVIIWDINTGEKTDVLYQPNGDSIRCCIFAPDGNSIITSDDYGWLCVFGQNKQLKKVLKGIHEESVPTLAFTKDSRVLLSACTMGNMRFLANDFEGNLCESE